MNYQEKRLRNFVDRTRKAEVDKQMRKALQVAKYPKVTAPLYSLPEFGTIVRQAMPKYIHPYLQVMGDADNLSVQKMYDTLGLPTLEMYDEGHMEKGVTFEMRADNPGRCPSTQTVVLDSMGSYLIDGDIV